MKPTEHEMQVAVEAFIDKQVAPEEWRGMSPSGRMNLKQAALDDFVLPILEALPDRGPMALMEAAAEIRAKHPGEVKNSVIFLENKARKMSEAGG